MSWRAFLSYSRQQYHFAESLALTLQQKGVALWFDVQQLEPGSDWKADIEDGLTRSDRVLLLASKAALASPYVEREWRHALERRKTVIVGVIEAVRIPRDLRRMPILDLRGDFTRATEQLIAQLQQPTPPRPIAAWRTRLAPGVNRMARALVLRDVQQVLGALLLSLLVLSFFLYSSLCRLATDGLPILFNETFGEMDTGASMTLDLTPYLPWAFAIACALLLLNLLRVVSRLHTLPFVARNFDYNVMSSLPPLAPGVIIVLWGMLAFGPFDFMRQFFDPRGVPSIDISLLVFTGIGVILMWVLPRLSKRLAPRHPDPDIVRFAELGKVPTQWRAHVNGAVAGATYAPQRAAQGSLTVHAYAEPSDLDALRQIRPMVEAMGGQFVADDQPARYDLVVLSHATSHENVRKAMAGHEGVLGIIASRCTIPAELQQLRNLQLVDFSQRDSQMLTAALGLLTASSDADRMRMQSYRDPVSITRAAAPPIVHTLAQALLALALLCLLMIGVLWVTGVSAATLLPPALALGVCALALIAANTAARRGRSLLPRPMMIVLASLPLLLTSLSAFALPAKATLFGTTVPLFPQGALALIAAAAVLTWIFMMAFLRHPHVLVPYGRKVFGMSPLRMNPLGALGWVIGVLGFAGLVVGGGASG